MTGRIPFGLPILLTVLVCAPAQAQNPMGPFPGVPGSPPGAFEAQPPDGQVFHQPGGPGQYQMMPNSYYAQGAPMGRPGPAPRTIFEEQPDDLGFVYEDTPLGKILTETLRRSWFRGEYLMWNASGPSGGILGQQPLGGVPHVQLVGEPVNIPLSTGMQFSRTVSGATGNAEAPGLDGLNVNGLNGFRGTFGVPLPVGQLEFSSFVFAKGTASFTGNDYIQSFIAANPATVTNIPVNQRVGADGNPATNGQVAQFITQPIYINGAPAALSGTSAAIDYDVSYRAVLTTSTWGTEANYVFDSPDAGAIFHLRPSVGFRYFDYRDSLDQFGQYNVPTTTTQTTTSTTTTTTGTTTTTTTVTSINTTAANVVQNRTINSSANNNLWGPQIGLRAELAHSQFVFGFEPKIMMAADTWQANLQTANVFSPTDRSQNLTTNATTFSPLVDLKAYTNVALSKNVSVYGSYNFLYAGHLLHSYNDILYNQNTAGQSDFHILRTFKDSTLQGWSFGFDVRF